MTPAPSSSADFDRAYRASFTIWGDIRIPVEIKALAEQGAGRRALELGCGVGRFSRYLARQGMQVTGVDFSPVAIERAKERVVDDVARPTFLVGDVTQLDALSGPFDLAFDVGCFHCLEPERQRRYAAEVSRLLRPGATHLIWALDQAPSDERLSPARLKELFAPGFELQQARKSRRRLIASHWYWLVRTDAPAAR
jgi:cyclopropane fatty-acyl-phospholipid synthase-like methyltransferase